MTSIGVRVNLNIDDFKRFQREIRTGTGRFEMGLRMAVIRYRTFIQRRYNRFSRGGGDWAPLKSREGSILRDTNTLFTALSPTFEPIAGSLNKPIPFGFEVGYGGSASHGGDGPTIVQLAIWHQTGAGYLPAREIIVVPDVSTAKAMARDMERALNSDNTFS